MEEKEYDASSLLAGLEARFQELGVKLEDIEQKVDGTYMEPASEEQQPAALEIDDKPVIEDELAGYRQAVQELQNIRQEIHRLYISDQQDAEAQNVRIIYEMLDLLKAVRGHSEELSRQCTYLQETKESLAEIGNSEKLAKLLDELRERMENLGGCNAKIKEAADTAMERVATMEEILDKRMVDMNDMEKEVLTSSHVLRQTAEKIDTVVREAGHDSIQTLKDSMENMNQEFAGKVSNIDSIMQELVDATRNNTDRTEDMVKVSMEQQALQEENQLLRNKLQELDLLVNAPEVEGLRREWGIDGEDYHKLSKAGQETMMGLYKTYKRHDKLIQAIKDLIN